MIEVLLYIEYALIFSVGCVAAFCLYKCMMASVRSIRRP